MNVEDNRALLLWTTFCVVGGVICSLVFGGILSQLLLGG